MPSFKLWILSAVLLAIVFPRSTVVAEEAPADKGIVGSWKWAPISKEPTYGILSVEFRPDGTLTATNASYKTGNPVVGTWKLVDKGEKRPELEWTFESGLKRAFSFAWISKDEFTATLPKGSNAIFKGFQFQRKKDAPKP